MPEYLFTAHRGSESPDVTRALLPDVGAARREAMRYVGELLLHNEGEDFLGSEEWTVTVSDDAHLTLFTMNLLWRTAPAMGERRLSAGGSTGGMRTTP